MVRLPPVPISVPLPFLALAGRGRKERRAAAFIVLLKVKRHPSLGLPDAASERRMVALLDEVITPSLGGRSGGCERTGPFDPPGTVPTCFGKDRFRPPSKAGGSDRATYPKG